MIELAISAFFMIAILGMVWMAHRWERQDYYERGKRDSIEYWGFGSYSWDHLEHCYKEGFQNGQEDIINQINIGEINET